VEESEKEKEYKIWKAKEAATKLETL